MKRFTIDSTKADATVARTLSRGFFPALLAGPAGFLGFGCTSSDSRAQVPDYSNMAAIRSIRTAAGSIEGTGTGIATFKRPTSIAASTKRRARRAPGLIRWRSTTTQRFPWRTGS